MRRLSQVQMPPTDEIATAHEHHSTMLARPAHVEFAVERYALVYGTDTIWDTELLVPMKSSAFSLAVGREMAREWQAHPNRRVVMADQVVFDPTGTSGPDCINLFRGFEMAAVKGSCSEMLALLVHLVSESADSDEGIAQVLGYVLDWLAYPLQNPGAKLPTALVFHGPQGTGKNLFFESFAKIYGPYAGIIGQPQIDSRYNDWASAKLFFIADEVSASHELSQHKNVLKSLITSPVIQIETKFQPTRPEPNHGNFVFLSNEEKPMALERDDRRYLVVYCPAKNEDGLYGRVAEEIEDGGIEAFYEFLLARDLSKFHPHTRPPMTKAKADLVELGLKPSERFAREWLGKELDLPLWPCSTNQLYRAFTKWAKVNGERFVPNQANFSASVSKYGASHGLTKKTASPSPSEGGTPVVLWLPRGTGPKDGVRWIDFARDCVATYEGSLSRFGLTGPET